MTTSAQVMAEWAVHHVECAQCRASADADIFPYNDNFCWKGLKIVHQWWELLCLPFQELED